MQELWKRETALHPTFDALNRCLAEDWFLLAHELRLQRAHAATLRAAGLLSTTDEASILRGLDAIGREWLGRPCPDSPAEDLHTWVENQLAERCGEAGRRIHAGRSRNDQVATLIVLFLIEAGEEAGRELASLGEILCRRAQTWSDLVIPLLTHTQFAAPGNAGFWALRFAVAFNRMRRHLAFCVGEWRSGCPLGSGAVAGTSLPLDRSIQARELGFAGPSPNALASTSCRDECLEWLALAAQIGLHLQGLAADVIGFAQTPLDWVEYPPEFGAGSSMMPNKRNPDALELLRGECCALAAAHAQALLLLKGLPSGYNRDLQCLKPVVRQSVEMVRRLLQLSIAFMQRLEFKPQALAASLRSGHLGATLRMEQMVREGAALRDAHHRVADTLAEGDAPPGPAAISRYSTIGSASPQETRRVASELLSEIARLKSPHS